MPREPSTPRIAVWRRLNDLGVVKIVDGLVALPHDARTLELLQWTAAQVLEAGGEAVVWTGSPTTRADNSRLSQLMIEARQGEYQELLDEVAILGGSVDSRTLARLRRQHRRITRRDYFGAPLGDETRLAIAALSEAHVKDGVR